jgi:nitroreductase
MKNTASAFRAWNISPDDFPSGGTFEDILGFILNYAILAPSTHNTQPWLFRVHSHALELFADKSRALPTVDPDGRELIMSCGAALSHIQVALQYFGYASEVTLLPDSNKPDLLARLVIGLHCETDADSIVLFQAIPGRRTNRRCFRPESPSDSLLAALQSDALSGGAWLEVVTDEDKRCEIADLVAEADRVQWRDKQFRCELAQWLRSNAKPRQDGIPGYAEGLSDLQSRIAPLAVRTFDLGKGQAARDRDIARFSPVLAVLGTYDDHPKAWLHSGQALAKILLRAQSEGVAASFLNQPIEVPALRTRLATCVDHDGFPQILLRLGYAEDVPPTPRRALSRVLTQMRHGAMKVAPVA